MGQRKQIDPHTKARAITTVAICTAVTATVLWPGTLLALTLDLAAAMVWVWIE